MADLNKIVEDLSSLTVIEAAELSKLLEEKWGVSAAAPVAVAAAPAAGGDSSPAEEKSEFDLVLSEAGANKIAVIKEVRTINKSIIKASSFTNNHFARGGMTTKIMAAKIATNSGCGMVIVNGNSKNVIQKIFENNEGTYFHPKKRKKNN